MKEAMRGEEGEAEEAIKAGGQKDQDTKKSSLYRLKSK